MGVRGGPLFEQVEVLFAHAAGQVMATALQPQFARRVEADSGIGPVELLFDDEKPPFQSAEGAAVHILVARLQARAFEVMRARIFADEDHGVGSVAMAIR